VVHRKPSREAQGKGWQAMADHSDRRDRVEERFYERWRRLVAPGEAVILAISGGIDSLALAALAEAVNGRAGMGLALVLVHIDHGLRKTSSEEAQALRALVRTRFHRELEIIPVVVNRKSGMGLEMAAREARHRALEKARSVHRARLIALAHQADDQAETVLMRILRGTGISGLTAMAEQSGVLVRPLLSFQRHELLEYLNRRALVWLEDPSNNDRDLFRNRVRLEILPYLRQVANPDIDQALRSLAEQARHWRIWAENERDVFLADHPVSWEKNRVIWPAAFSGLPEPVQVELLRVFAERVGIRMEAAHLEPVLRKRRASWPGGWTVGWDDLGRLVAEQGSPLRDAEGMDASLPCLPGFHHWGALGGRLWVVRSPAPRPNVGGIGPGALVYSSWIQVPSNWQLRFRTWRFGDRLRPRGLGGRKKVQDVFVDRKITQPLRRQWPILVHDSEDPTQPEEVLAVVGLAEDESCRQEGIGWQIDFVVYGQPE
jgi:tRNA(Ile)-lysidine synthase